MMRFLFGGRYKGQEPNHKVGVRRLLANACVFPCNALFVIASEKTGTPKDTFVLLGKRSMQA